jgi:hypothetical protein
LIEARKEEPCDPENIARQHYQNGDKHQIRQGSEHGGADSVQGMQKEREQVLRQWPAPGIQAEHKIQIDIDKHQHRHDGKRFEDSVQCRQHLPGPQQMKRLRFQSLNA